MPSTAFGIEASTRMAKKMHAGVAVAAMITCIELLSCLDREIAIMMFSILNIMIGLVLTFSLPN